MAVLATLVAGAALAGCSDARPPGTRASSGPTGSSRSSTPGGGSSRATVEGETLEGERLSLDDYRGKVVVLNVWGSWCGPCRKEAPALVEAARELGEDDVAFVGINTRDSSQDQGLAFQRRYDVPYPSLFDPSGRTLLAFAGTLNPSAIPSTVVLDRDGRVAASILGEIPSRRTLVDVVEDVLR